jgi:hydroxymethylbilane synthase
MAINPVQAGDSASAGRIVLGTRASKLALIQADHVKAALNDRFPSHSVSITSMSVAGDRDKVQPLYLIGGKSLWTKELEVALLDRAIDGIVHSCKDIPTTLPDGCVLSAIMQREDPSDALVVKAGLPYTCLDDLPDGSTVGTSSVRRIAQLRRKFPRLIFSDMVRAVLSECSPRSSPLANPLRNTQRGNM